MKTQSTILMMGLLVAAVPAHATALTTYTGTASGTWSNPVLSGNIFNGATRAAIPMDDGATAFCSLGACPNVLSGYGSDTLAWGTNPQSSWISFAGNSFSNMASGQIFELGILTYFNGGSATNSNIFGADFTLTMTISSGPAVDPLTVRVPIITTTNNGSSAQNADAVSFGPYPSQLSLGAYETATVTAGLYGEIVGDPTTSLQFVQLDPAQSANGFVGGVPEPATLALAFGGLAAFGALRRRNTGRGLVGGG